MFNTITAANNDHWTIYKLFAALFTALSKSGLADCFIKSKRKLKVSLEI